MRTVHIEANGTIVILTWWNEKPNISIVRTDEEKERLTVNNKFGDVIPISALRKFQKALIEVLPELKGKANTRDAYYTSFNTLDNESAYKLIARRLESEKEYLTKAIHKEP